jgi:hypothetical protein
MFRQLGGYDVGMRYSEDYDLWLRLAEHFPFVSSHQITCRYRVHGAQASASLNGVIRGGWKARLAAYDRLVASGGNSGEHDSLLLAALRDDAESAWYQADAEALSYLLHMAPMLVGGTAMLGSIRCRVRWLFFRRAVQEFRKWAGQG